MKSKVFAALAALSITGLAVPAHAHDYAYTGEATSWNGFYLGASVGYGIADSAFRHTIVPDTVGYDTSSDGVTGTVTVGYDVNFDSSFVAGIFADYTFGELDGNGAYAIGPPSQFSLEYDNTWAIGGRIGLARPGGTLWYLTAGYTETELTLSDAFGNIDRDLDGYFLGAGVEQQLHHHGLSLKLEYRFSDYGSETLYEETVGCCLERYEIDSQVHAIRLGVSYKFGRREAEEVVPLK